MQEQDEGLISFYIPRDELHRHLGAGIPKGSLVVVEGVSSAGKSAFVQRLTYGALSNDRSVTYISTELTTVKFIEQMNSFEYHIAEHLLEGRLLFLCTHPFIGRLKESFDPLELVRTSKSLYGRDLTIIDSFTSLPHLERATLESFNSYFELLKRITSRGATIILTVDTDQINESMLKTLRSSSDIHISLSTKWIANNVKRFVIINRFLTAPSQVDDKFGFRIERKIGFLIDISGVA